MLKAFRYRLYPTSKQLKTLESTLDGCRWLYNHLLAMRKQAWEQEGKGLSCFAQQKTYAALKQEHPELEQVYSQVLQNVAVRVDLAFRAFFRRCKAGEHPPVSSAPHRRQFLSVLNSIGTDGRFHAHSTSPKPAMRGGQPSPVEKGHVTESHQFCGWSVQGVYGEC